MNDQHIDELWTRLLDGSATAAEEQLLAKVLAEDPTVGERLRGDAEMDGLLAGIGQADDDDGFVERFAARLTAENGAAVIPLDEQRADFPASKQTPVAVTSVRVEPSVDPVPPPVVIPPTVAEPPVAPTANAQPVSQESVVRRSTPSNRSKIWMIVSTVAAAALLLTFLAISLSGNKSDVAKSGDDDGGIGRQRVKEPRDDAPKVTPTKKSAADFEKRLVDKPQQDKTKQDAIKPLPVHNDQATNQALANEDRQPKKNVGPVVATPKNNVPDPVPADRPLGVLVKASNAVWDSPPSSRLDDAPMVLKSGTAEIRMANGATVTLSGPVAFQLDAADRMLVAYGRVSAHVPPQAVGFVVETPLSRVVDLGTRFNVTVENDGATDVRVTEGKVELKSRKNPNDQGQTWQLVAGEFKRVGADGNTDDFNVAVQIDATGRGAIRVNETSFDVSGLGDFERAEKLMANAMGSVRNQLGNARQNNFQGAIVVNGRRAQFDDQREFDAVQKRLSRQLGGIRQMMNRAEQFRGQLNINGEQFGYRNLQEMLALSEQLRRRMGARGGAFNAAGLGNLDEILRVQREMLRNLGINGRFGGLDQADQAMRTANELLRGFGNFGRNGIQMPRAGQPRERELRRDANEQRLDEARQRLDRLRGGQGFDLRGGQGLNPRQPNGQPVPKKPAQAAEPGFGPRPPRKNANDDVPPQASRTAPARTPASPSKAKNDVTKIIADVDPADKGMTSHAMVQLALDAELLGEGQTREQLLEQAVKKDPSFAPAQWHSGRVFVKGTKDQPGKWMSLDEAEKLAASDSILIEYGQQREKLKDDAEGNEELAIWCSKNGLDAQSKMHWARVLKFKPGHVKAQKRLGMKSYKGRLMSNAQIDEIRGQSDKFSALRRKWLPKLKDWKRLIRGRESSAREVALKELSEIDDPRMIGLLETYLSPHGSVLADEVVKVLSKMPEQAATESLIRHAVFVDDARVRRTAAEHLKSRPMYGHVPLLIGAMAAPYEFKTWAREGGRGVDAFGYAIKREGRFVDHMVEGVVGIGEYQTRPARGANIRAQAMQARKRRATDLKRDLTRRVDQMNREAERYNQPIRRALMECTNVDLGTDPRKWNDWWNEYTEYNEPSEKPTETSFRYTSTMVEVRPHECFPAGTLVRTRRGLKPIETLRVGDFVLSQSPETGELTYKPIVQTTVREVESVVETTFRGESIRSTKGHPFWVNGSGWEMAKSLQTGDQLHGVGGSITIDSVREIPERSKVFNLVVAEFRTYFVGKNSVMVHDNSLFKAPGVVVPGERWQPAAKAAKASSAKK